MLAAEAAFREGQAAVIEIELADVDGAAALPRFETYAERVLERWLADTDLDVTPVYPVTRTASVLGSGIENWLTVWVAPWRNLVIKRGLAWP